MHDHVCAVGVVDSEVKTPKTRFVKPEVERGRVALAFRLRDFTTWLCYLCICIRRIIAVTYYGSVKILEEILFHKKGEVGGEKQVNRRNCANRKGVE
jgi:hypothetical protein